MWCCGNAALLFMKKGGTDITSAIRHVVYSTVQLFIFCCGKTISLPKKVVRNDTAETGCLIPILCPKARSMPCDQVQGFSSPPHCKRRGIGISGVKKIFFLLIGSHSISPCLSVGPDFPDAGRFDHHAVSHTHVGTHAVYIDAIRRQSGNVVMSGYLPGACIIGYIYMSVNITAPCKYVYYSSQV